MVVFLFTGLRVAADFGSEVAPPLEEDAAVDAVADLRLRWLLDGVRVFELAADEFVGVEAAVELRLARVRFAGAGGGVSIAGGGGVGDAGDCFRYDEAVMSSLMTTKFGPSRVILFPLPLNTTSPRPVASLAVLLLARMGRT